MGIFDTITASLPKTITSSIEAFTNEPVLPAVHAAFEPARMHYGVHPRLLTVVEPSWRYQHRYSPLTIDISCAHQYQYTILAHALELISAYPLDVSNHLRTIHFSRKTSDDVAAMAFPILKKILYPYDGGSAHAQTNKQRVFDHEMGHLVGVMAGPPNVSAWAAARHADATRFQSLSSRQQTLLRRSHIISGGTIQLAHEVEWITKYASDSAIKPSLAMTPQAEDWADSWSLFIHDQRKGYFLHLRNWHDASTTAVRFCDVYPHRARLLQQRYDQLL